MVGDQVGDQVGDYKKAGLPEPEFKEEFGGFSVCFYKDIHKKKRQERGRCILCYCIIIAHIAH